MGDTPAKTAIKDLSVTMLGGMMTLKVDALACRKPEERVEFKLVVPASETPEPTKPVQMYVHPDDVDSASGPVRMWKVSECERAREIDGILYRVTQEEIDAAKEPVIEKGAIDIKVHRAADVEAQTRPSGAVYRLRPKAVPHVYAMLVDLASDPDLAFLGEMTVRDVQRLYRLTSWNGALLLQECIRPGEFYDAEDYRHDYPEALLDKMREAVAATVEDFEPDAYYSHLREQAKAFDESKRDPNAPKPEPKAKPKAEASVDDLMAMLDGVAAKAKPKAKAKK